VQAQVTARLEHAAAHRGALAEVARVAQEAHARIAERLDGRRRPVGARVVDDEHLVVPDRRVLDRRAHGPQRFGDPRRLVVRGHDDGQPRR
jgi:hypothetical protein